MFIGIARWRGEWWFSGALVQQSYDNETIQKEKNSIHSKMQTDFLDYESTATREVLTNQRNAFLAFNNESPIAFMKSEKMDAYFKKYTTYYNNTLTLTKKEIKKTDIDKHFKTSNTAQSFDYSDYAPGLVFFNPNSGVEMAFGINSAFPLTGNSFFKSKDSREHILYLLMSNEISIELVYYCIDNCKQDLPFFNNIEGVLYLENIDFMLRFWKTENYYTKPAITFVG